LRLEAKKGEAPGFIGSPKPGEASQQDIGRGPAALGHPGANVVVPSIASVGSSSADAAEPEKAPTASLPEPGAGADPPQQMRAETQDRRPAARQQEISGTSTGSHDRKQCNLELCAARYKSFHAADCTYQPYGDGPRDVCQLSTGSADARPQTSLAASDPKSEAKDRRGAESAAEAPKSANSARAGPQCNVDLCATTYASFHAADCTYQPYSGGSRRVCER
jgi:hypothetical protein